MKARLEPVLTCLRELVAAGIWVEVTTLVVPGMNDSDEELGEIAGFIAGELGPEVPWHVSRFHGDYEMTDVAATSTDTLHRALEIGRAAGLKYLYAGNVPGNEYENTRCPACGVTLIRRTGFSVGDIHLTAGRCSQCNHPIPGVWE